MAVTSRFDITDVRARFSSLADGFAFFDSPGGTQTPDAVGAAMAETVRVASANLGAPYETGRRVGEILERAEQGAAAFLGASPEEITFGMNMTSLNFAISRAAARDWRPGDRVIVTALDHEANVAPWHALAEDLGLDIQTVGLNEDSTLDLEDLRAKLDERGGPVRVVAVTGASNALGTLTPVAEISRMAHAAGALAWVDAVHYAAHFPVSVEDLGADVLLCSPYKFCGPHLGMAFVRGELARTWRPYAVRVPAATTGRGLATGTYPFELLAALNATFRYLEEIGGMALIRDYELGLTQRLLNRLPSGIVRYGLPGIEGRAPTVLINVPGLPAAEVARALAERRIGVWSADNWYCLDLFERIQTGGSSVRLGISHYNDEDEVDRLVAALAELVAEDPG